LSKKLLAGVNMPIVSRRVDFSRRRENLPWSIHAEVAVFEPIEQDIWLAKAKGLSVRVEFVTTSHESS
jgi:hypothetical protein